MNNIYSCNFPNIGFMGCNLSDDEFLPILEEVLEIQKNFSQATPMNDKLIGHIEHEYLMTKTHSLIERLAMEMSSRYQIAYQSFKLPEKYKLSMDGAWVNFQKKHEFNPLHNHSGDFSFVIYVKIPYTIEEETKYTAKVPAHFQVPGSFLFHYTDALGQIAPWCIPTDQSYERRMILFPAKMMHTVYPFYSSDDFRISISGNLRVEAVNS
jgi:hypothetical protein